MSWKRTGGAVLASVGALVLAMGILGSPLTVRAQNQNAADAPSGTGSTQAGKNSGSGGNGWNGYGMGPGMMGGGYGMGSGMMGGGYGMGPGMMGGGYGGYGMGSGMMGGYGMGPIWALDLSDAQRAKIGSIADALRKKHWAIMGRILDEQAKLRDLYSKNEPDPKAVGTVYADISKLRQEMLEAHVQATNQARGVLTPEQKTELDKWRRQGWEAGSGSGE